MRAVRRPRRRPSMCGLGLFFGLAVVSSAPGSRASAQVAINGVLRPAPALLLPYYRLELGDPSGTTTLVAVRNSGEEELQVRFAFHAATSAPGDIDLALVETVAAHETLTLTCVRSRG